MEKSLTRAFGEGVAGGIFASCIGLTWPLALTGTILVIADCITAILMERRLRLRGCKVDSRFNSHRFGRVVSTLGRYYAGLLIAGLLQVSLLDGAVDFDAVRFMGGTFCFRQIMSILENESTANNSRWAARARRWLTDKTRRYMDSQNPDA